MRFPGAIWRGPIPNETHLGMSHPVRGLVLHIEEGSETGTNNWFHNPGAQASAHFGNPKTGPLDQWVDTDDEAWAEMAGNREWFSVEHEGVAPCSLTPSQLENDAQLLAWLHKNFGVPLQVTDDPNGFGLGWHGMGGQAWGGHLGCPGDPIKAQRAAIIARAKAIANPPKLAKKIVTTPVKAFIALSVLIKSPVTSARNLLAQKYNPPPIWVPHPGGGDALCYVSQKIWQGIPSQPELARLQSVGVKQGSVPASWWTTARQVAW